jgi:hypothetical protein
LELYDAKPFAKDGKARKGANVIRFFLDKYLNLKLDEAVKLKENSSMAAKPVCKVKDEATQKSNQHEQNDIEFQIPFSWEKCSENLGHLCMLRS